MPVGLASAGHILTSQASTHHRVVVMLDTSAAELDIVEARSIARHPNVISRLQLSVDNVAAQARVDLEARVLGELHVGLEAHRHDNVVGEEPVGARGLWLVHSRAEGQLDLAVVRLHAFDAYVRHDAHVLVTHSLCGPLAQVFG